MRILKFAAVLLIVLWLQNNPPQHTMAEVNKQDVQHTGSESKSKPVGHPQPVQQRVKPVEPKNHPKGCDNYVALVRKYDWNHRIAINIMRAESMGCNPSAVGDNYPINGIHAVSCGLFQIRTLAGRPSCKALKNPALNVKVAYRLYKSGGWRHWSVCRTVVRCY